MTRFQFDDRNIHWHKLANFDYFVVSVLDIDKKNKIVDVLIKFEPHQQIVLHRHKAQNNTLVIQGEHRLYEPDGALKEVRPVGSYTCSPAKPEPHRECGGDEGAVVFFSIRGNEGVLYEVLDDQQNLIGTLSFNDFIDLYEANQTTSRQAQG